MMRIPKWTRRRFPYHENYPMSIESHGGEFVACLQSIGTVMFLDTWFPTHGDLKSYSHIELTSRQHWNPHKIEFPQTKYSVQEEVEGRNISKVTICLSGETTIDTDHPLDGDTRGNFGSHNEEVVVYAGMDDFHRRLVAGIAVTATHASAILTLNREVVIHAGMNDFHRRLVAGVAVTATHASAILTVNRDKKREILLAVSSKNRKYRADRMAARIVADIISKEKITQQVSFADEQVDTMKDVSIPRTFLSENRHSSMTEEDISKRWGLSIYQAALTLKSTTQKLTRSAIMPLK